VSEKRIVRMLELAAVAALAQVPVILASPAAKNFVASHPGWAVYVPIAVSVAAELYTWLKPKVQKLSL